jgi:hypothetical protein
MSMSREGIAIMTTDTVVLHLPDDLYRRIAHLSSLTGSPLARVIVRMLALSLPPLPDDFAPETRAALQGLEQLGDTELATFETATLPTADYARLTELRERRSEGAITPGEQAELERLLQAADTLTLQKAYAAALLTWREQARQSRLASDDALSDV